MQKSIIYSAILSTALIFFSCTTVKVTKVDPDKIDDNTEGLRYSLGKPLIKVTPNQGGDGTYAVELIYVPDNDRTYAASASSFMSKHTLEVNMASGILSKISLTKDGTTNVTDAAGAFGEMAKTEIARRQKEADEKKKEVEAELKENKTALKNAEELLDEKRIAHAANKREIGELEATSPKPLSAEIKEKIRTLNNANFKLQLEMDDLKRKINKLGSALKDLDAAANMPDEKKEDLMAYGPVFFEIKEIRDVNGNVTSVSLVVVKWPDNKAQMQFKTVSKPGSPINTAGAGTVQGPALTSKKIEVKSKPDGSFEFDIAFDKPVLRIDKQQSTFGDLANTTFKKAEVKQTPLDDKKTHKISVPKNIIKKGTYTLTVEYFYALPGSGEDSKRENIELIIK